MIALRSRSTPAASTIPHFVRSGLRRRSLGAQVAPWARRSGHNSRRLRYFSTATRLDSVHAWRDTRAVCGSGDQRLRDLLRQRSAVGLAQHCFAAEMSMAPQRVYQSIGHRHVTESASFRGRHSSLPIGSFDAQLPLAEIDVGSVKERTQEIGVRMALGASSASVFRMILGQALLLVLTGIGTGLLASAALTRLLAGLLFDVEPLDPTTFAATSIALLTIATLAAYLPARRSMRMAPVEALRTD